MWLVLLFIAGCLSGFILFQKQVITDTSPTTYAKGKKISVIIPTRNEAKNLPFILESLKAQSPKPLEIIVVDDFSEDDTKWIAESFGVTLIENTQLPKGWTGKNWAVWNGFLHAKGDILIFLDADVRLSPHAIEDLFKTREKTGGVISVYPYHYTEKFYERFALITNLLGIFVFSSPFEKNNSQKGLFGACILTTREDYEKVGGHKEIKSEVLDDLSLGAEFVKRGIRVDNFTGHGLISFRMYPNGIKSEIQGFSKSALLGASKVYLPTILFIALWVVGLLVSESVFIFVHTSLFLPLAIGYLLYMFQLFYFARHIGRFGVIMPLLHVLSSLFFLLIMLYSTYQTVFTKKVMWKGREIKVRGKKL